MMVNKDAYDFGAALAKRSAVDPIAAAQQAAASRIGAGDTSYTWGGMPVVDGSPLTSGGSDFRAYDQGRAAGFQSGMRSGTTRGQVMSAFAPWLGALALGIPVAAVTGALTAKKKERMRGAGRAIGPGILGWGLGGPGGAIGAAAAPQGHRVEGGGRGALIGMGAGLGAIPGALGGAAVGVPAGIIAQKLVGNPSNGHVPGLGMGVGVAGVLAGAGLGAYGGGKLTQRLLGKPSWKNKEEAAVKAGAALFKRVAHV